MSAISKVNPSLDTQNIETVTKGDGDRHYRREHDYENEKPVHIHVEVADGKRLRKKTVKSYALPRKTKDCEERKRHQYREEPICEKTRDRSSSRSCEDKPSLQVKKKSSQRKEESPSRERRRRTNKEESSSPVETERYQESKRSQRKGCNIMENAQTCEEKEIKEKERKERMEQEEDENFMRCQAQDWVKVKRAYLRLVPSETVETKISFSGNTAWSLTKVPLITAATGVVDWTLTVNRETTASSLLTFEGEFSIVNKGEGDASIGNIVSNLQRRSRRSEDWKTISSNIANSFRGSAATSTQVTSEASSEGVTNFQENTASVSIDLAIGRNSVFATSPSPIITAGQTVKFSYKSVFNGSILELKETDELRLETLMSFGNSGARGSAGYSCAGIDIDGDGKTSDTEHKVVSLEYLLPFKLPDEVKGDASMILADPLSSITTTGGATFTNYVSFGNHGVETIRSNSTFPLVRHVMITAATVGQGMINNVATLSSLPDSLQKTLVVANSTIDVAAGDEFKDMEYCTFSQEEWGTLPAGSNAGTLLAFNFARVYPSGYVMIGSESKFNVRFSLAGVQNFLPASGEPGAFTSKLTDPSTTSAGVLAGEVLALQLSVDFNRALVTGTAEHNIPALIYNGEAKDSLNGKSIAAILALTNSVLAGEAMLTVGYTLVSHTALIRNLNASFDNCTVSAWALAHLSAPVIPPTPV